MARISFSFLCPASWYFTVPTVSPFPRQRVAFLGLFFISCLLLLMLIMDFRHWGASSPRDRQYERASPVAKESACQAGDPDSIPGLGRSPVEGNGNPLQYSCQENPMDRGAWQATIHRVIKELDMT